MYIKICGETLDPGKHLSLSAMCQLCWWYLFPGNRYH